MKGWNMNLIDLALFFRFNVYIFIFIFFGDPCKTHLQSRLFLFLGLKVVSLRERMYHEFISVQCYFSDIICIYSYSYFFWNPCMTHLQSGAFEGEDVTYRTVHCFWDPCKTHLRIAQFVCKDHKYKYLWCLFIRLTI